MTTSRMALVAVVGLAAGAAAQPGSVLNSPHNLSTSGLGPVRAAFEQEVCIFCHTPHNARPIRPLWNRATPVEAYTIYRSRSLEAQPGQPTGSSKMCLSCHDGTIAVGSVFSRDVPIVMVGGLTTLPPGAANLGTDLSDDHPISFRYDSGLALRKPTLKDPALLPEQLRLDPNQELQCTTCHDAHDNSLGKFLTLHNGSSELCMACHQMGTTTITQHQDCNACHQPHTAPSGPYLLRERTAAETCLKCHDGAHPPASNIAAELQKLFIHDTGSSVEPAGPANEHATCTDCHEAHTMDHGRGHAPQIHPSMGRIEGLSQSGAPVAAARYEYETCFRCHADGTHLAPSVPRVIVQNNTRLEFDPGAVSFHPVTSPGRNTSVPSLVPGWTVGSMTYCSDCHGSEAGALSGGLGPRGVHGSNNRPLLVARYETADGIGESLQSYALCYQCHDRGSILGDESFTLHRRHVVDERTPCSVCHDAHGIASSQGTLQNNSHLINFDSSVVFPDQITGRLQFVDQGAFSGQCFLSCHGTNHSGSSYQR